MDERITFSMTIARKINPKIPLCQVLVLVPNHELAARVHEFISMVGNSMSITSALIIGGTDEHVDVVKLKSLVQIVVGTPGRVRKMISRRLLPTKYIELLVLDGANKMLSRLMKVQTQDVIGTMPISTQIVLISAAKTIEVLNFEKCFKRYSIQILAKTPELSLQGMRQFNVLTEEEEGKQKLLFDIYESISRLKTVIFCNTRKTVELLLSELLKREYSGLAIHCDMTQTERDLIVSEFCKTNGGSRVLITTDLLTRGIDVQSVFSVINYDLPPNYENYIHRIGRWAHFGKKGNAINFVTKADKSVLEDIELFYNTKIVEMPPKLADMLKKTKKSE